MNWQEAHALVTGGTRGIGTQLVTQLLAKGAQVTGTGTTEQALASDCAIFDGVAKRRAEIDVGATALLRLIMRLSPSLGEPIMIGR